jgi:hypothetical protein
LIRGTELDTKSLGNTLAYPVQIGLMRIIVKLKDKRRGCGRDERTTEDEDEREETPQKHVSMLATDRVNADRS